MQQCADVGLIELHGVHRSAIPAVNRTAWELILQVDILVRDSPTPEQQLRHNQVGPMYSSSTWPNQENHAPPEQR